MFYVVDIEDTIRVPPIKFADNLEETLKQMIFEDKVNILDKNIGLILGLIKLKEVGKVKVEFGDGGAYVDLKFSVLVFKPELQKVYKGFIKEVVEFGVFMDIGPFEGLIHLSQIMDDYINYDPGNQSFIGRDSKNMITKGNQIYAKVVSVSFNENVMQSKIGLTMRQEGLGKEEWILKLKEENNTLNENKDKK